MYIFILSLFFLFNRLNTPIIKVLFTKRNVDKPLQRTKKEMKRNRAATDIFAGT